VAGGLDALIAIGRRFGGDHFSPPDHIVRDQRHEHDESRLEALVAGLERLDEGQPHETHLDATHGQRPRCLGHARDTPAALTGATRR
jgi:hypothetical protein